MLSLIIGSILFIGVFLEQYQWGIVSIFFTIPLILTSLRNPDYFSIPLNKKLKVIGYPILVIELITWILFTSRYDFLPHQNFYTFSFTVSQIIGCIFLLFFISESKELSKGASNLSMVYLLIILGLNNVLLFLNYPRGHSYYIEQIVIDKNIYHSKGINYYLKFDTSQIYNSINVDSSEYVTVEIGDTIKFEYKHGRLNYNGLIGHKLLNKINH